MPALTLTIATGLVVACGVTEQPEVARILAHMQVESALDPVAIHDNTSGKSFHPDTPEAATALARNLTAAGHSIDAGLMQINSANWRRFDRSVETIFSPLANVCTGVAIWREAQAIERRTSCRYNTGKPDCPVGYPERVDAAQAALRDKKPETQIAIAPQQRAAVFWRPSHRNEP
jgi:type IV secretion system protein VirB1